MAETSSERGYENVEHGISSERIEQGVHTISDMLKKPATGASIAGAVALGAAAVFGVAEAAVGATAAWVAYRIFKKREERHLLH